MKIVIMKYASKIKWGLFWLFILQLLTVIFMWVVVLPGHLINSETKLQVFFYIPLWVDLIAPALVMLVLAGAATITRSKVFVSKNALILMGASLLLFSANISLVRSFGFHTVYMPCDESGLDGCDF
jgi:hypothetical protein